MRRTVLGAAIAAMLVEASGARTFDVRDFGAAGDGRAKDTVEQPSLIDMNAATPAKGISFVNVDVPQDVMVKNADVSFCGGTFRAAEP